MNGAELRVWRTSRGLYQRDVVRIAEAAGIEGVDQPTVSEWERGIVPVPDELPAILELAAAKHPEVQAPTPAPAPRKKNRAERRQQAEPEADDDGPELEPEQPEPEPAPEPQGDVRPKPVTPPASRPAAAAWSREVRSQLERDLLTLLAGQQFLVPVPVEVSPGVIEERHEEAFIPGIAQLVGFVDEFDGRVVEMNAPQMARAWCELAEESPKVRGILLALTYGGAWRGVIAATLPVVYSIGVHHGLIPPVLGGAGAAPPVVAPTEPDAVAV